MCCWLSRSRAAPVITIKRHGRSLWWFGACAAASSIFSIIYRGTGSGLTFPLDMRLCIASKTSMYVPLTAERRDYNRVTPRP